MLAEKALSDYKATEDECSSANELDSEADLSGKHATAGNIFVCSLYV